MLGGMQPENWTWEGNALLRRKPRLVACLGFFAASICILVVFIVSGSGTTSADAGGPSHNPYEAGDRLECASDLRGGAVVDNDTRNPGFGSPAELAAGFMSDIGTSLQAASQATTYLDSDIAEIELHDAEGHLVAILSMAHDARGWHLEHFAKCG
jgi:hypothetical protein